ncbi:MAG: xanthine dehydrogenase family protein molybdopterin-binding subunit [Hyphomicrobiales bacterium]|nr:xanthine dehydrogenase family protein molybdopterin-binding subunit [Hyphomicrobiales bacterium]MBV8823598.1 xanthine dehydrogenase family protein molybdopterin-binding subunit [Hyphomicrobiales bacterium]MBV9429756.1 xanthine dehydrogenase family protein molybdopterin-binding subunit [Bradyrhizobiaceae bacterium]
MLAESQLSRRDVINGLAAGAVVLVAGRLAPTQVFAQAAAAAGTALNAWVAIAPDGIVTLQCAHSEMGQGIMTTFAAIIADELEADWSKCEVVFSPVAPAYRHPVYNWQFTGNAESIRSYHALIRKMGAAAREMLIAAAADRMRVPPSDLAAREGSVRHPGSGRTLGYGELAAAAAGKPVPAEPRVKPESEWRLVGGGRSLPRRDIPAKVEGSAIFGIDVKVPGMVYAAIASAPTLGGKIANVDRASVAGTAGVLAVVPLDYAVAVVAEHYWQARLALEKLKVTWQPGPGGSFDDANLAAMYAAAFASDAGWATAEAHGDAPVTLSSAQRVIEAEYRSPWLSHAPMEPMNATVSVTSDGVTVWAPTQGMQMTQIVLAKVLNVAPEKITVHRTFLGGGFGRRLLADFVAQAALCSKAAGRPVKLIWSREEDIGRDWYRPAFLDHARAALGPDGLPAAIHHRLVAPSILAPVSPVPVEPGTVDGLAVESLVEHPYKIANRRTDYHMLQVPIPTMVLRTTGHGPNNFALESLIDELAHAAGQDPYQYRRRLLAENAAALAVVDRAAALAGWGKAEAGRVHGMAFADCFGSYLCQVAELSVIDGAIKLHKMVSVCDPGRVLDRVNATSLIEGGVVWGLSAALYSAVTFANGHVRERNFDGFRVVTLPDTPELVTDFLQNRPAIGGLGEVGPVCVPAALANAVFAATGRRVRSLPLAREGVFTIYGKTFS